MKKLCFVFIAAFIANLTYSQGDLENQFYFRFGPSVPSWKYYGNDDKNDYLDDVKRGGGIFEMGNIFMLNGIKLLDGMRIGINVDYLSLNYNRFKSKDAMSKTTYFFWGVKFGPSFTYSPVDKIAFDAYIKFNPVILSTRITKPYKFDEDEVMYDEPDPVLHMGFFGPKLSVGFNIRMAVFMLGFEYNPGIVKYNYYDDDEGEFADEYLGRADKKSDYTPTPCMNITMGFSF